MIRKLIITLSALVGAFAGIPSVAYADVWTTVIGTAPANLVDPTKAPFYVDEGAAAWGGTYVVHNNTKDYALIAFGVTTPNADSYPETDFVTYVKDDGSEFPMPNQYWRGIPLGPGNWTEDTLRGSSTSAQALFGDMGKVLGADGHANYYEIWDANVLWGGWRAETFRFFNSPPASQFFGLAVDPDGNTYSFYTAAPVPEPETYAMMLAGLGFLGALTRRRRH